MFANRDAMIALLKPLVGPDGVLKLHLAMPDPWKTWYKTDTLPGDDLTPHVREVMTAYLRLCGFHYVEGDGPVMKVDLVDRHYDNIPYMVDQTHTTTSSHIEYVPDPLKMSTSDASEYNSLDSKSFMAWWKTTTQSDKFKLQQVETTQTSRTRDLATGAISVPTLTISIQNKIFEAPPYTRPNKPYSEGVCAMIEHSPNHPANATEAVAFQFALDEALLPWRFGRWAP